MLENLRDKLQTVHNDLSTSLKSLAISSEAKEEMRSKLGIANSKPYTRSRLNLSAGADLLHHYQTQWRQMHASSERNARLAQTVGQSIGKLDAQSRHQYSAIGELVANLSLIPQIDQSLTAIERDLVLAKRQIILLESRLTELVGEREADDFERHKLDRQYEMAVYGERKASEFESRKARLAFEHSEKVRAHERSQQNVLRERQQAFQTAFEEEISLYKSQGKIGASDGSRKRAVEKKMSIEEVVIEAEEADAEALHKFLDDS